MGGLDVLGGLVVLGGAVVDGPEGLDPVPEPTEMVMGPDSI